MTITEFLTARLDEDEAETWVIVPYDCAPGCCAPEGWVGRQCQWCDSMPVYGGTRDAIVEIAQEHAETVHQRSRVLADIAAKRAILALHDDELADEVESGDASAHGADLMHRMVISALAQPYAEHPDYDPAWRTA